jgi:phosphatidylglycerophosphatase A
MLLAFGFGSGLSRFVPGTLGTVAALPIYFLMAKLPLELYLLIVLLGTGLGVYLCDYAARTLGVHDHGGIVWDEFVGFWITMIALPYTWQWVLAGFVLFRFFDMVKPWPINWLDKHVHGGMGIMLDDVVAALMALVCLHGYRLYFL